MINMSPFLAESSHKKCCCTTPHCECQGNQRAVSVAVYPPGSVNPFARCAWEAWDSCLKPMLLGQKHAHDLFRKAALREFADT